MSTPTLNNAGSPPCAILPRGPMRVKAERRRQAAGGRHLLSSVRTVAVHPGRVDDTATSEGEYELAQAYRSDGAFDEHHLRSRLPDDGAIGHHRPRAETLADQRGDG